MRSFLPLFALAAVALAGLASSTEAAQIEFEYQVLVADPPTHSVWVYKPGRIIMESLHWSLEDAQAREAELEADGYTASVRTYHVSQRWLNSNSDYVRTFDNYEDAVDFALNLEQKTGLYAWVKTVEVIPGGP